MATLFIVAWVGLVHAIVLIGLPADRASIDRWIDVEAAVLVVAVVVRGLAARNERLVQRLAEEARVDPLTGLLNRRGFDERLLMEQSRARRDGTALSVVCFDIDRFKAINDTHGHEIGDRALASLGNVVAEQIRGVDSAARVGGDEFVVLLPGADAPAARAFAERVRRLLADPRSIVAAEVALSISAGIATNTAAQDAGDLVQRADRALYHAKSGGRDRVVDQRDILAGGASIAA